MSTIASTSPSAHSGLSRQPTTSRFSDAQWHQLLDEDRVALLSVSILLGTIIGVGMLGMAVVVAILVFSS